jgi:uncharacterized protein YgiM (DUF1202 family)
MNTFRRLSLNRVLWLGLVVALIFSAAPGLAVQAAPADQTTGTAVVTNASYLNVRSGPGVAFGVVTRLGNGAFVTLIGRNADGSWTQIQVAGGAQGWVNSRYLAPSIPITNLPVTQPITTSSAVVTAYYLNLRSGPGAGYSILRTLRGGDAVSMIARLGDNSWVQVSLSDGLQGWLSTRYIQANAPVSSLPVAGGDQGGGTTPPPPPASSDSATVTAYYLNVRYGPGVGFGVITRATRGEVVRMLGRNAWASWVQIQTSNGIVGWVNGNYLAPNMQIWALPITF